MGNTPTAQPERIRGLNQSGKKPPTFAPERRFRWIAAVFFVCVSAANYLPVFAGRVPFPRDLVLRHAAWSGLERAEPLQQFSEIGDLITSFYPFHTLAARAWHEGTIGLWNPFILSGAPLLANLQSALFYPFNFLYYALPTSAAWTLCLMFRMFLAGWFMALLVRSIGGSKTGALLSGLVFSTCGFMTAWQGQAMGDAAIWLPMICYSVHRLHIHRSVSSVALAAISFAMPVLAGHPETAFHLTVTGSALALMLWLMPTREGAPRFHVHFALSFALAGLLALGLSSIQLIPGIEWAGQPGWSYDVATPALTWHDGQGFFSRDIQRNLNSAGIPVPEAAAYIGMVALLAAPLAFFHRSRRFVVFFASVTAVATAIAFSVQPAHWIVTHLPYIKVMKHGRLILVASFGVAALAGLGVSALQQNTQLVRRRRMLAFVLIALTSALAAVSIYKLHLATLVPVAMSMSPAASMFFLCAAVVVLSWGVAAGASSRTLAFMLIGLAAIEMVSFSYGYTGFARPAEIFPAAPVFDFLREQANRGVFRFAKAGYPIPANAGAMYGLEAADGYEVCLLPTRTFCRDLTEDRDDAVFFLSDRLAHGSDRRLDMLNVKYFVVISPSAEEKDFARHSQRFVEVFRRGAIAVFENRSVLPRLFAVPQSGIEVIESPAEQLIRTKDPGFDPTERVVFAQRPPAITEAPPPRQPAELRLVARNTNSSEYNVRLEQPSVLVLSQIYYQGWKASIDGVETPVYKVNYALSGILAPAGGHKVRFFFDPLSVKVGAALSAASLSVLAALGIGGRRFGRSSQGGFDA